MGRKNNTKTDEYLRLERRNRVAEHYLKGWTQQEIAASEKVAQATVSADLAAIRKGWLESSMVNFDEVKARELARIDALEAAAWAAWDRSCEDAITKSTQVKHALRVVGEREVQVSDDEADGTKKEPITEMVPIEKTANKQAKGQAGDPRFMERISWCIEQRVKIFGIVKKDDLDAKGVTINLNWNDMSGRSSIVDPVRERLNSGPLVLAEPTPVEQSDVEGDASLVG